MNRARVLVVDDDAGMLRAIQRILAGLYEVCCCQRPQEALDQATAWRPDLTLLDIRMPEMSGFDLLERLRGQRPDMDTIVMTGSVHELDAQIVRAIRADAYYFIQKPFDREVLLTLVERCIQARRLLDENRLHVRRLERELDLARHFQLSLLPPDQAHIGRLALHARFEPCSEVAGDLYDYVEYRPGCVAVIVADVAGHGVAAAMLTGIVKAAFHGSMADDYEPLAVVKRAAASIRAFPPHRFVTLFCLRMQAESNVLEYVNAGHPPGLVWSPQQSPRQLDSTGPLVCSAMQDQAWEQATARVPAGGHVLLYTDGIPEAGGGASQFGIERIAALAGSSAGGGRDLLEQVLGAVHEFVAGARIYDDLTLVTLASSR